MSSNLPARVCVKSLDTLGSVMSIFLVLDSSRKCELMLGGSTSLVQWISESKNLQKDLRIGFIARWIIMLLWPLR